MARRLHRLLSVPLLVAATASAGWWLLPSSKLDEWAFTAVCHGSTNPPFEVAGHGSLRSPWSLRMPRPWPGPDPDRAPLVVSIGDDPERIFQSNPPSPVDLAVILSNLRRLGFEETAIAYEMAWKEPDPISLVALEAEMARFRRLTVAVSLSRAATPSPVPAAFRRASIPLEAVAGEISDLPLVNDMPVSGVILGGDSTLAGFSILENEPGDGRPPLVARWQDRAVLAFPLVAVINHLGISPDEVEIRLGEVIKLGAGGPAIPIDLHGCLAVTFTPPESPAPVLAEDLIDGKDQLLQPDAGRPLVIRDDRSAAAAATLLFSSGLPGMIAAIAADADEPESFRFYRLSPDWEIASIATVSFLAIAASLRSRFRGTLALGILAFTVIAAQTAAASVFHLWLPGLPALAALIVTLVAARCLDPRKAAPPVTLPPATLSPPPAPAEMASPPLAPAATAPKAQAPAAAPLVIPIAPAVPAAAPPLAPSAPDLPDPRYVFPVQLELLQLGEKPAARPSPGAPPREIPAPSPPAPPLPALTPAPPQLQPKPDAPADAPEPSSTPRRIVIEPRFIRLKAPSPPPPSSTPPSKAPPPTHLPVRKNLPRHYPRNGPGQP